eukprot:1161361-Pelagomonas_calceolata.AAC.17
MFDFVQRGWTGKSHSQTTTVFASSYIVQRSIQFCAMLQVPSSILLLYTLFANLLQTKSKYLPHALISMPMHMTTDSLLIYMRYWQCRSKHMAVQADHAPQPACPGRCPRTASLSTCDTGSAGPNIWLFKQTTHRNLHAQADAQVRLFVRARVVGCQDLAFHASPSKATLYKVG